MTSVVLILGTLNVTQVYSTYVCSVAWEGRTTRAKRSPSRTSWWKRKQKRQQQGQKSKNQGKWIYSWQKWFDSDLIIYNNHGWITWGPILYTDRVLFLHAHLLLCYCRPFPPLQLNHQITPWDQCPDHSRRRSCHMPVIPVPDCAGSGAWGASSQLFSQK